MTVQDVSGDQVAVETPKNDYVTTDLEPKVEPAQEATEPETAAEVSQEATKKDSIEDGEVEAEQTEDQDKVKKRRGGFQKKIARLEAEIAALKQTPARQQLTQEPTVLKEPNPADFQTQEDLDKAFREYTKQQIKEELKKESRESDLRREMNTKAKNYELGVEKAREVHEDFDDVIESYDGPLTVVMQQVLLNSEVGPEVAYYLAKHPEEAVKIASFGLVDANKAIGKIEAKLEFSNQKEVAVTKSTKAPPPINPAKGKISSGSKDPGDMSYEDFKVWRSKNR